MKILLLLLLYNILNDHDHYYHYNQKSFFPNRHCTLNRKNPKVFNLLFISLFIISFLFILNKLLFFNMYINMCLKYHSEIKHQKKKKFLTSSINKTKV